MKSQLKQYEKILEKIVIKFGIAVEDEENALEVIETIKENSLSISLLNVYPELLKVKSSKVNNIITEFMKVNLPITILEKNPIVIEKTNGARINKIKQTCDKLGFTIKLLEKYPEIIAIGKDTNIEAIVKIFEKNGIDKKYFYEAGDILAYGEAKEVDKIIQILEKNGLLKNVLKKNTKVFYQNSAEVVNDIIKLYKDPKEGLGLNLIKNHLEILSETTKVRIQAIMNMLERHGITQKVLVKEPAIVYKNDTKDIESLIISLKNRGIDKMQFLSIANLLAYDDIEQKRLLTKLDFIIQGEEFFGKVLTLDPEIVINSDIKNIREYIEEIEKGKLRNDVVRINPSILKYSTPFIVEKVLINLIKVGLENYYVQNPEILLIQNPENILQTYDLLKENLNVSEESLKNLFIKDCTIFENVDKLRNRIFRK